MYDPSVGRWLSEDPIGFEGGDANLERYVGNNPTNATDPTGLFAAPPWQPPTFQQTLDKAYKKFLQLPDAKMLVADVEKQNPGKKMQVIADGSLPGIGGFDFDSGKISINPKRFANPEKVIDGIIGLILLEMLNGTTTSDRNKLDSQAKMGDVGRVDYIATIEKAEFDNVRRHHAIAAKAIANKIWGPASDIYGNQLLPVAVFTPQTIGYQWSNFANYLATNIGNGHATNYGVYWDKNFSGVWGRKHPGQWDQGISPLMVMIPGSIQFYLQRPKQYATIVQVK